MNPQRLLILDDDIAVGQTMSFIAESMGMEVRVHTRPAEFMLEAARWQPHCIVLDLVMPELDGVEVIRLLAERGCRAGVIIASGVGDRVLDAARRSAAAHGLDIIGVLPKPFSTSVMRGLLSARRDAAAPAVATARVATAADMPISEADLRRALLRRELQLVYQPRIECATGWLSGFEALVRWRRPNGSLALPEQFLPLAEKLGLVDTLTEQVIESALPWLAEHYGASAHSLSINLSPTSLLNRPLGDYMLRLCQQFGIDPRRLSFELTDAGSLGDSTTVLDQLTRLRMKGFELSIDQFGTGDSTFERLAMLPFSEIKIDRSFVAEAARSPEARNIVLSMIELAHKLQLRVTANGVEQQSTLDFLATAGCDYAQGQLIAAPMTAEAVRDWALRSTAAPVRRIGMAR